MRILGLTGIILAITTKGCDNRIAFVTRFQKPYQREL